METNVLRRGADLVPVLVIGVLLAAVPLSLSSMFAAGALAGVAVMIILTASLGLERSSVLFMVLAFALAPADVLNLPGLSFLSVSDGLFFVALALALPRLVTTPVSLPPVFLVGSFAFILIGLLSCFAAADPAVYYYTARVVFVFVVLPVLVVWWAPRGAVLLWLLVAFGVGTAVSVAYGIPEIGAYRNFGLSQHPNILGYTAALALSLVPFLFLALPRRWRVWVCGGIVASAGVGIVTSGSRAALVVALLLVVLVPAIERSIPAALVVATAGVAAIGVLARSATPGQGQDALSRLRGAGDVAGANEARVEGVEQTWQIVLDNPWLGTGFNFVDFVGHNAYVQVGAGVGILGLAAFVVILGSMLWPLVQSRATPTRLVYPALVFVAAGPVSPQLTDRYIGLMLGIALVGGVLAREQQEDEVDEPAPSPSPRVASAVR